MRASVVLLGGLMLIRGLDVTSSVLSAQSSLDGKSLIHLFYLASGGDNRKGLAEAQIVGEVNAGGTIGTFHQIIDLKDGRDVLSIDADSMKLTRATLGDSGWQADQSGLVTYSDTPSAQVDAINQSFQNRNGWFAASASELRSLGIHQDQGKSFDLVAVTPPGGRKMTLWLGAADHLLYRIKQQDSSHHEYDTIYSDYRRIGGVMMPFSIRESNGNASQDTVFTVRTIRFSSTIDQAVFTAPASRFKDARLLGEESAATLPFTIDSGRIVVEVSINGRPAVPFLFDSGGSNYITPQAAKLLGVKGSGNVAVSGTGAAQESGQFATANKLLLGPVEMLDQQFLIGPLPKFLEDRGIEAPIAGLVGAELLRRFPTTINYQQKTLTFYKPGTQPPEQPNACSFRLLFDGSSPFIQVKVDDVPGIFEIDTGDSSSATIFSPFYRAHEFPIQQPAQIRLQGGVGGLGEALLTRVRSLGFGPWQIEMPLVTLNLADQGAFSNDSIAGNLGYEILKNFVFTLDYEHRKGYFLRSSDFGKPIDYNRAGAILDRQDDGKIIVQGVNRNTPAEQAGIRVGDAILSVNGKAPQERMLYEKAGTPVDIRYSRGGEERRAVFHLKELLPIHGKMKPLVHNQTDK